MDTEEKEKTEQIKGDDFETTDIISIKPTDEEPTKIIETKEPLGKFGEYTLIEKIGEGGMATVYKAYYGPFKVLRAVKVLSSRYINNEKLLKRFKREALLTVQLQHPNPHPNIVTFYDVGIESGRHYIGMEYIDGYNLNVIIKKCPQERIPITVALSIAHEICKALSYAHRKDFVYGDEEYHSIVHRDIKPSNIMITKDGIVKLTDFGIARALEVLTDNDFKTMETEPGVIVGSISYMSPEQIDGKSDKRTDIYSLGVVLYEIITGQRPFRGDTRTTILRNITRGKYIPPRRINPITPKKVEKIIMKAMHVNPARRYQDIDEMREDIRGVLTTLKVSDPAKEIKDFLQKKTPKEEEIIEKEPIKIPIFEAVTLGFLALIWIAIGFFTFLKPAKSILIINTNVPGIEIELDNKTTFHSSSNYHYIYNLKRGSYLLKVSSLEDPTLSITKEVKLNKPVQLLEFKF